MTWMLVMTKETVAERVKRIRQAKKITKYRLAKITGIGLTYIYQLENGRVAYPRGDTLMALAKGLGVSVSELTGEKPTSLPGLLAEIQERYEALEVLELPVRGVVPAGYPFPEEEGNEGHIRVPREDLAEVAALKDLYALKVSGDSLDGDDIHSGDFLVIEPTTDLQEGRIYVVRLANEVCARHVHKMNDHLKLTSSNGTYKEILATDAEILGRVILSGRWKKH